MTADAFERRMYLTAAWDRRDPDPRKNYGVHGVDLHFALIGPLGAVSWRLMTPWVLPQVAEWWATLPAPVLYTPTADGVYWHRQVDGLETAGAQPCNFFGACVAEQIGSISREDVLEALIAQGDAGVWAVLERTYHEQARAILH